MGLFTIVNAMKKFALKNFNNKTKSTWIARFSIFIIMFLSCYLAYNTESMKLNEFGDYWNGYIGPFLMLISLFVIYFQLEDKKKSDEVQNIKTLIYRFRQCANETQLYEGRTTHKLDRVFATVPNERANFFSIGVNGCIVDDERSLRKGPEFFHSFLMCILYARFKYEKKSFYQAFDWTMKNFGYLISGYFNQLEYAIQEIKKSKVEYKNEFINELIQSMTISELILVKVYMSYNDFDNGEILKEKVNAEILKSKFVHPKYEELLNEVKNG